MGEKGLPSLVFLLSSSLMVARGEEKEEIRETKRDGEKGMFGFEN